MKDVEYLIPRKGVIVRDPDTKVPLPPEGMVKDMTKAPGRYWRRRIKDGDVFVKQEKPPVKVESELRNRKVKKED